MALYFKIIKCLNNPQSKPDRPPAGHHSEHFHTGARPTDGHQVHVPGGRMRCLCLRCERWQELLDR